MRTVLGFLAAILAAAGAAVAEIDPPYDELVSPYEEVRLRAADALVAADGDVEPALVDRYARADFRTKALILDVLARRGSMAGLPLLLADAGAPDRGVVLAGRRHLTTLYGRLSRSAAMALVPIVKDDYRREEAVRAFPAAAATPRRVLAELADAPGLVRAEAAQLGAAAAALDELRAGLRARATDEAAPAAERRAAAELLRHLARLDAERTVLAVHETGVEGSYDGMYELTAELVEGPEGGAVLEFLGAVARGVPPAEGGVPPVPSGDGGFLLKAPVNLEEDLRSVAAAVLSDVAAGREEFIDGLAAWFENRPRDYSDALDAFDFQMALTLAAVGRAEYLEDAIVQLEAGVGRRGNLWMQDLVAARLAAAYGRLGRHERAVAVYRSLVFRDPLQNITRYNLACAYSRAGQPQEAFASLERAVELGYGLEASDVRWLERDRDLEAVRKLPEFAELLRELKARFANR